MSHKESQFARTPIYFGHGSEALYGILHANELPPCDTESLLIICPPVGIDYMNAYRGLRYLADAIAQNGTSCLRLDYLSTGNSADGNADNDIDNFVKSIELAHQFARNNLNFKKIALLGYRFGASLAAEASTRLDIEYLILWSPHYQGRRLLREIRLLQQSSQIANQNNPFLEAGGWVIDASTQQALGKLDLQKMTPNAHSALIIDSPRSDKHHKLAEIWKAKAIKVTTDEEDASHELLVDAHSTVIPVSVIDSIVQWVRPFVHTQPCDSVITEYPPALETRKALTARDKNSGEPFEVIESARQYEADYLNEPVRHFCIKTEPSNKPAKKLPLVLLLNSGSNHQVGPHRLYVTISRQLANLGFTSIRMDLPGLGESVIHNKEVENLPYMPEAVKPIKDVLETLDEKPEQIILMGLCSGAYHAFLGAIELPDLPVKEVVLINPLTFYWEQGMTLEDAVSETYSEMNWYKKSAYDKSKWIRLLKGEIKLLPIFSSVLKHQTIKLKTKLRNLLDTFEPANSAAITPNISNSLKKITHKGCHISLFFSENDPGVQILKDNADKTVKKLTASQQLEIYTIEKADHTFSRLKPRNQLLGLITQHFHKRYLSVDSTSDSPSHELP